jgi:phosphoribosylamine--glycine ligase
MAESVLLVGGGGREHALAAEMAASPDLDHIYCAPGNPGTAMLSKVENVAFGPGDIADIVSFAKENRAGLTVVVGPEAPLVAGLGDQLRAERISVFGPNAAAAQLEGSKAFASDFMHQYGIPQPESTTVRDMGEARAAMSGRAPGSVVLKADGLAGGKGVVLPATADEAEQTLQVMLSGQGFDKAGKNGVVIQERLTGPEVSVFVVSDGHRYSVVPFFAQDHKRRDTGDRGPNTGGMGAYTPVPKEMISDWQLAGIQDIADRTIGGMADQGMPYQGVLYMGLMLAEERDGGPVVIEYNARFGDPEAEVILPALTASGVDVYSTLRETAHGHTPYLGAPQFSGRAALTVCLAAEGYPDSPKKGAVIAGLGADYPNVTIHHGGTKQAGNDVVTAGGRVLYVTGQGETVDAAAGAAYAAIGENGIRFAGMHYRTDIGHQARSAESVWG